MARYWYNAFMSIPEILANFFAKLRFERSFVAIERGNSAPSTLFAERSTTMSLRQPRSPIEVGLLRAFRVVIGTELVLSLVGSLVVSTVRGSYPPVPIVISVLSLLVLFCYLCSERLESWLSYRYLPVGLFGGALLPLVDRLLFIRLWIEQNHAPVTEQMLSGAGWRVLALLLIPLVFTAWQYDFPRVLLFVVGTLVTDFALLFGFFGFHSELRVQIVGMVLAQSVIFIVVGYIISRMMYAQREQRRIVDEANQQLTHYAATIEQLATSRERNRLARELHDTLAHSLSALAVQLDAVDTAWESAPNDARNLLIKAIAQTRSGLTETRRALQSLRASPLEDLGLQLAVKTLAAGFAQRAGWQLDLQIADDLDGLPPDLEQILYRIAAEALNNILKHAEAETVAVTLQWRGADLALQIRDDGRGFDPATAPNDRFGLTGMRERAAMVGGLFTIESDGTCGTTIVFVAPHARVIVVDPNDGMAVNGE